MSEPNPRDSSRSSRPKKLASQKASSGDGGSPWQGRQRWVSAAWIVGGLLLFFFVQSALVEGPQQVPLSRFLDLVQDGRITEADIGTGQVTGSFRGSDGKDNNFVTTLPPEFQVNGLVKQLRSQGKDVTISATQPSPLAEFFFAWVLPFGLIAGLYYFFILRRVRQQFGGGSGGPLSLGKNKAKLYDRTDLKTTFADVAGVDEVETELVELVDYLRNPDKFSKVGARIPKGVLLVGPPGTGKTLLARAVAGEAKVPFFYISASEFIELFVGLGAARVRDLFQQARQRAPAIVFIDEMDAIGQARSGYSTPVAGHQEQEQTLQQLLTEMDGFEPNSGVILVAASNRPEVLDAALLRPGRFDRQIQVNLPEVNGRDEILRIHARGVKLEDDVDFKVLARRTPG